MTTRWSLVQLAAVFCVLTVAGCGWVAPLPASPGPSQTPPPASPDLNLELVGQIGGPTTALAARDTLLYVGVGPRLAVWDASNPTRPVLRGQSAPLRDTVRRVASEGDLAYVAAGSALHVLDVSNPAHVITRGTFILNPDREDGSFAGEVAIAGHQAFLTAGDDGLRILDLSDPAAPREVGAYRPPGATYYVAVEGNYAYLTARPSPGLGPHVPTGLRIVDISSPARPIEVGFATSELPVGVLAGGGYAYLADLSGLRILDISNPSRPSQLGFVPMPNSLGEFGVTMALGDGVLYMAAGPYGLRIIDVSDPAAPRMLASHQVGLRFACCSESATGVALAGSYAYVSDRHNGLRVVDVTNPMNPTEVASIPGMEAAYTVAVTDRYAFVVAGRSGLLGIDISEPAAPTVAWSFPPPIGRQSVVWSVALAQGHAYVFGDEGGEVLDLSDPGRPTPIARVVEVRNARDAALAGEYLYVASRDALNVLDVGEPTRPRTIAVTQLMQATSLAISEGYAYVGSLAGLHILDISEPSAPSRIGDYEFIRGSWGVAASGRFAYVVDYLRGVLILDVSDPSQPRQVGYVEPPVRREGTSDARSLERYGIMAVRGYLFYAMGGSGVRVVDVTEPATPVVVGYYNTGGAASGLVVRDGYIYVADWDGGLLVLQENR